MISFFRRITGPRPAPILTFISAATLFVPVWFHFGVVEFMVPTAWGIAATVHALFSGKFAASIVTLVQTTFHLAVFLGVARLFRTVIDRLPWKGFRNLLWISITCGVISCSFLRALTYSSIQGQGGTYTFWTALERLIETQRMR